MRFRLNTPYVISETIDGETIIIHLGTGLYYSLEGVDGLWEFVTQSADTGDVIAELQRRYDAPTEEITLAVRRLFDQLQEEDLITAADDVPSRSHVSIRDVPPQRLPFTAPVLAKYTDMQDLVLLDPVHEVSEAGWPRTEAQANGV